MYIRAMKQMHTYYIGVGSNLENGIEVISEACETLTEALEAEVRFSQPCMTAPIDFPYPALFANCVAEVSTLLTTKRVDSVLKRLEVEFGRTAEDRAVGIVALDLDILSVDGKIIRPTDCQRPYIQEAFLELGVNF